MLPQAVGIVSSSLKQICKAGNSPVSSTHTVGTVAKDYRLKLVNNFLFNYNQFSDCRFSHFA